MIKNLRNRIFFFIDNILPDIVRELPYHVAIKSLKKSFSRLDGISVWHRNSTRNGNFVFGVSDLDITILTSQEKFFQHAKKITKILQTHKVFFPFLGEANFYIKELIIPLSPCLNYFEKIRDPEISVELNHSIYKSMDVEKIVFMLRMLYSDRKNLREISFIRQRKWRGHFKAMGFDNNVDISSNLLCNKILELMKLSEPMNSKVMEVLVFVLNTNFDERSIYTTSLPEFWKFIFPNKHIWINFENEETFRPIKNTILSEVCLRQLDWEVWGLMSQIPFLPSIYQNLIEHLPRQGNAHCYLSNENTTLQNVQKVINVAEKTKEKYGDSVSS